MCLLVFALKAHPSYKLILAANRDEFYERPTAPAEFWDDTPQLLAGKDLKAGGTWLGITRQGKIAAITNYRDPSSIKGNAPSRGWIVSNYLLGSRSPDEYLKKLLKDADRYNGFNLVLGDRDDLYWYSNRCEEYRHISAGIYGLSNHLLDTPWPKISLTKRALSVLISNEKNPSPEALFRLLEDRSIPDDSRLPSTGVGLEWERILSPVFIRSSNYGTRSSTLLFVDRHDHVSFYERTFNPPDDHVTNSNHEFDLEPLNVSS
jgi:uncharacterized protein with NRDE domain